MVRKLLGNIKGQKGDPGEKGDKGDRGEQGIQGSLKDESIGVVNMIDITKLTARGTTATYDYDIESGVVNYSGVTSYLSADVTLNGVQHTFRVDDFLSNPTYYTGLLNFQVLDSAGETVVSERINPKTNVSVDLTGRDRQEYQVLFRVTSSTAFSGFIEKPMLVEGDISVLWNNPVMSGYLSTTFTNVVITSQSLTNNGTKLPLNSSTALNKNCNVSEGSIVLNPGIWKIAVDVSLENTADKTQLFYIRAIQNSNTIATSRGHLNGATFSLNLVIRTNGDPIDLYVVQNSGSNVSTLSASFNRVMAEYLDS